MPWSFQGPAAVQSKKSSRGRGRGRGRGPSSRPRNIGRSLVNAEIREMLKEEKENSSQKKEPWNTVTKPAPAVSAKPCYNKVIPAKKQQQQPRAPLRAKSMTIQVPRQTLRTVTGTLAAETRTKEFKMFWQALPVATQAWKAANQFSSTTTSYKDQPVILSFQKRLDGTLCLGAVSTNMVTVGSSSQTRRPQRRAVLHIQNDKIVHRWTDATAAWEAYAFMDCVVQSVFAFSTPRVPPRIGIVLNHSTDSATATFVNNSKKYSHWVFMENDDRSFPSNFGWK